MNAGDSAGKPLREKNMKQLAGILLALCCLPHSHAAAQTQSYPTKPVTIVVAYPAGGAADVIARSVGQRLSSAWGQPVIIENRGGASTQIGASYVSKAAPDGYMLLATDVPTFTNSYLYSKLPYDPARDFVPVTGLGIIYLALVVHPSFPARSVSEFVELAKKSPDEFNYATLGVGSTPHLSMEMFGNMTRAKLSPIHYRAPGQLVTDLISGRVPAVFLSQTLTTQPSKAGQLRTLALGSVQRVPQFPDLPTVAETVPGYESSGWFGLFAPRATPHEVVAAVNAGVQKILTDPGFRETFLIPNFYEPLLGSPEQFAQFVQADSMKWGVVIQTAKLSLE